MLAWISKTHFAAAGLFAAGAIVISAAACSSSGTVHASSGFNEYTIVLFERFTPGPAAHPAIRNLAPFISTRTVLAARVDGSFSRTVTSYGFPPRSQTLQQRWITDVANARETEVAVEPNAKTTRILNESYVHALLQARADSSAACDAGSGGTAPLRETTILGRRALQIRRRLGDLNWVLPEFGCRPVRWTMQSRSGSGLVSTSETDVEAIIVGPPDPALFSTDAEEMKPSDLMRRIGNYRGVPEGIIEEQVKAASARDLEYAGADSKQIR